MEKYERKREATLLVVEDNDAMRCALTDILEDAGYRVLSAENGKEALEVYRRNTPNLILSDTSMPEMDGLKFLELVRRTTVGKSIPFIFLATRGMREDIFNAKILGADDYLVKPITRQELLMVIEARLRRFEDIKSCIVIGAY